MPESKGWVMDFIDDENKDLGSPAVLLKDLDQTWMVPLSIRAHS